MTQMDEITNLTGHTPAILGCDYANGAAFNTPPQKDIDYTCNEYLKDHSNKHGIVTIDTHFPNPVSPNGGDLKNRSNLTFTDLLKPETETGQRWRSYLDIVAEGLDDLQKANVTVLYRPFHEMNGGWFWWGQQVRIFYYLY
jgi:mannan endo-1,4-beta-mannosidase